MLTPWLPVCAPRIPEQHCTRSCVSMVQAGLLMRWRQRLHSQSGEAKGSPSLLCMAMPTSEINLNNKWKRSTSIPHRVTAVNSKAEMIALLQNETAQGGTPVLSAFGRWGTTGRLSGIMGELVRSDVSRVLAIGPQATSLAPKLDGCIVVSSDGVYSVDPLMEGNQRLCRRLRHQRSWSHM